MIDPKQSLARRMVDPKGMSREHFLIQHLPYVCAVTDEVMMLRGGDLIGAFTVEGVHAQTIDPIAVDDLATGMAAIVAQFEPDIAIYVHRLSTGTEVELPAAEERAPLDALVQRLRAGPEEEFPRVEETMPLAAEIDRRWQADLRNRKLRSRSIMVSVLVRPKRLSGLWSRLASGGATALREQRAERTQRLNETIGYLMEALAGARPRRLNLLDGTWLGLIGVTVTGQFAPTPSGLRLGHPIADGLCVAPVEFQGDTFCVVGRDAAEVRYGAVFSLKQYPTETVPGIFDRLDLSLDMAICQSFTPMDQVSALERVNRTAKRMSAADDAAISLQAELVEAADDLSANRISFGMHHATVTVFCETLAELDDAVARVRSAGQQAGCVLTREKIGARAAYFGQHPGNFNYRARAAMISSTNFAHLTALHRPPSGLRPEETPWGAAVTVLPTISNEAFRFNFHLAGAHGDRTVGHTLIIGQTGAGKTLGAAFLIAQAMRVKPRVIVFDKDQGFEAAVRGLGGNYSNVRMGVPTGFNPFRAEADNRGVGWLSDWITAMLRGSDPLTALQREAIQNAVMANSKAGPGLQTLGHFRSQFRSTADEGDLHTRLGVWDRDGQYGWLFAGDEGEVDALSFASDLTAFDLTEIFDADEIRTAWLSYVFRRIERLVEDERPTLLVLDEAWKLLDDPYFEARLKDWMLTMRKKNVAVVLMTQRVEHVRESKAGGSIFESTATTILYPNARFTPEELAPLKLTDSEASFACSSSGGMRAALIRSGETSVVADMNLASLGSLIGVLGGGRGEKLPAGWRDDPDFWREE